MKKLSLLTSEFPPFRGGIGIVAYELASAAVALGVEVDVIAPDYLNARHSEFDDACTFGVKRYRAGPYAGKWIPEYMRQAIATARNPNAGRLIAVDSPFLEVLALTQVIHRKPFDAIVYGSEITRAGKSKVRRLIGFERLYGAPERYVAISEFTRNLLLGHMPFIDSSRAVTAYLAANSKWFSEPDVTLCESVIGPGSGPLVVCTGRITPRKGQVTLLRALQTAPFEPATRANLTVVIAGRATEADQEYFELLLQEANNTKPVKVIIRGDLDDDVVRALYSVADLFCLPGSAKVSAVEGFGLVFIEAAAQGLPCVAGAVGAVPESVIDGQTGILVPPDNPSVLGAVLAELLADQNKLDALGISARNHASHFSWEAFAQEFLGKL